MKMKTKVLAVLALALLMMNMAPVMRAEAATASGETSISVTWHDEVQTMDLLDWQYYFIAEGGSNRGGAWVVYSNAPLVRSSSGTMKASDGSKIGVFGTTDKPLIWETYSGLVDSSSNADSFTSFRANHDIYNEDGSVWLKVSSDPEYEYIYSATGPVAATSSAGISNLMKFVPVEADDTDDFYVQSNWAAQYDEWKYSIIYSLQGELPALAGSSPTDGNMYKLYTESVIAFPSKDVVTGWISSGMSPVECYFETGQTNWRNTVYDGKNTFVKVKVINESIPTYHSLMNGSHAFQVDIPMTDIMASVDESFDGGLRGYYGLSLEMWEMWKNSIYEYKVPYEIYTVLYAKEDIDTMVYGNMHYSVPNWTDIDHLTKGYVFIGGIIEKPLEDITDDDKQEIQIDTTREELAKRTEELEQLKKEYAEALKMNGSDEDVFELFGNFTAGLRSSSASFKNVATAVGNVFAFFPEDITGLLYGGIIAMIVIAIVKAIRG